MGDSIMRPPTGKKNMPWRVSDKPADYLRTQELLERFRWLENGCAVLKDDPMVVLMYERDENSYKIVVRGAVVAWRAGRRSAAVYVFENGIVRRRKGRYVTV